MTRVNQFDLIIFDEASQIGAPDAIGAISRGKQLIVVGDPKQLPPTNVFEKKQSGEDFNDEDIEDSESILDECQIAGLPQRHLRLHYRSLETSVVKAQMPLR